jgi:hypothetical protein
MHPDPEQTESDQKGSKITTNQRDHATNKREGYPCPKDGAVTDVARATIDAVVALWRMACFGWGKVRRCLKGNSELITALSTVALVAVAFLQWDVLHKTWDVLHKTDDTLRDTLKANKAQTRAMVYFQTSGWTKKRGEIPRLPRFIIGNSGLTETLNLRYATDCLSSDEEVVDPVKENEDALRARIIEGYTLGPRQAPDGFGGGIPLCGPDRVPFPYKEFVYVYGCASYQDIFGAEHQTQFCARVHPFDRQGIDVGGHCKTTRRSCVDKDCKQKSVCDPP